MKCNPIKCGTSIATKAIPLLDKLSPISIFGLRVWVANIFWQSALLKIPAGFLGIGKGNWDSTLMLFQYEHPVPGLPPEFAAYMGTTVELIAPIMLVLGLGSRIGATMLLFMTAVIEFTYQSNAEHLVWALFLSVIFLQGPGKISIDHFIRKRLLNI